MLKISELVKCVVSGGYPAEKLSSLVDNPNYNMFINMLSEYASVILLEVENNKVLTMRAVTLVDKEYVTPKISKFLDTANVFAKGFRIYVINDVLLGFDSFKTAILRFKTQDFLDMGDSLTRSILQETFIESAKSCFKMDIYDILSGEIMTTYVIRKNSDGDINFVSEYIINTSLRNRVKTQQLNKVVLDHLGIKTDD